ncbi:hypothetical protein U9M48_012122 [Paspalum notatum var. saurae]|uniref:Uncharacterized protein n=1 Tax=Paspalum notatum var. saurae TaxID=547442 RepID=A0AAQ3SZB0_PASNO
MGAPTPPGLDDWSVPRSSLTGLVWSLAGVMRVCYVLTTTTTRPATTTPAEEERRRMHSILVDEPAATLGRDTTVFRGRVDQDVCAMSLLQATRWARAGAMDAAVRDLEDERMRLECDVTETDRRGQQSSGPGHRLPPGAELDDVLERWVVLLGPEHGLLRRGAVDETTRHGSAPFRKASPSDLTSPATASSSSRSPGVARHGSASTNPAHAAW